MRKGEGADARSKTKQDPTRGKKSKGKVVIRAESTKGTAERPRR